MRVYILGGFLGSGKTTLLMDLAGFYAQHGKRTAIIVNEAGDIGVDGETVRSNGYDVTVLPDGCVCCTLAIALEDALKNIKNDIDPEVVIIEPTGLALPTKVKEIVENSGADVGDARIIGVCDAKRFESIINRKMDFFDRQLEDADLVLLNKMDLVTAE